MYYKPKCWAHEEAFTCEVACDATLPRNVTEIINESIDVTRVLVIVLMEVFM